MVIGINVAQRVVATTLILLTVLQEYLDHLRQAIARG